MEPLSFDEFPKTSEGAWLSALEKELKGKSPESLNWTDADGNVFQPYYRQGVTVSFDLPDLPSVWETCQHFSLEQAGINEAILGSLMGGVNAIELSGEMPDRGFDKVLRDVILPYLSIHLNDIPVASLMDHLGAFCDARDFERASIKGSVSPAHIDESQWLPFMKAWPAMRITLADARTIHQKGSSAVDDLVYCLSLGHENLLAAMRNGMTAEMISGRIQFNLAIGRSFFVEMAKLLALRVLWDKVARSYQISSPIVLLTSTSDYWQAGMDVENNLLRATSQALSAVCGGTDVLHVRPYDQWKNGTSGDSLRWARNMSHLLSDESGLASHRQAARGSWLVQSITSSLCDQAWKRFTQMEADGGWKARGNDLLQSVSARGAELERSVSDGSTVMVGVNKYPGRADTNLNQGSTHRASATIEKTAL